MSVVEEGGRLHLKGDCEVGDAEALVAWLSGRADARVDVTEAGWLHTAVVQAILVFGPTLVGQPRDAFMARWLMPALLASVAKGGES